MSNQNPGKALLENAYLLQTPEDNISYYDQIADSYDADFAQMLGYALPKAVANTFRSLGAIEDSPVLDVGCGTGLLAQALNSDDLTIDGIDISDAMLDVARDKDQYRHLFKVDLTRPLEPKFGEYGAILSSGTFTHGHLGPEALVQLLSIASKNALFIVTINKLHYTRLGFESTINKLGKQSQVNSINMQEHSIYDNPSHEHSNDKGLIISFRKS